MLTKELSAAERVQPRFIEPMYAEPGPPAQLPEGNIWLYEAKLDGYRCLAVRKRVRQHAPASVSLTPKTIIKDNIDGS